MKKAIVLLICLLLGLCCICSLAAEDDPSYYALNYCVAPANSLGVPENGFILTIREDGTATLHIEGNGDMEGTYAEKNGTFLFDLKNEKSAMQFSCASADGNLVSTDLGGSSGVAYIFTAGEEGKYSLAAMMASASMWGYDPSDFSIELGENNDADFMLYGGAYKGNYSFSEDVVNLLVNVGENSLPLAGRKIGDDLLFGNFLNSGMDWTFSPATKPETLTYVSPESLLADEPENILAEITIKGYETPVVIRLCSNEAPITVANFTALAESGFYNGLTFHRIIKGFMMQGGDPLGNGTGGSNGLIKGEFFKNGVRNTLSHVRGTVSMARSSSYDSASSQFFIMHEDGTSLDGSYAAFGYVISGMETVDTICETAVPTDSNGSIAKEDQPVIETVVIRRG